MSTHKKIDLICVIAVILTLALTAPFMSGEAFGLASAANANDDAGSDMFTGNDLNADWDTSYATKIALSDNGSTINGNGAYVYNGDVYIIYAGHYTLTGELTNGSVIVDAEKTDKIWLLLDGVKIHREDDAAIRIEQADKVFLTLAEGTENAVSSGGQYGEAVVTAGVDGAVYSRDDLTINGNGSLTVNAAYSHGIVGNDDLVITGGNIAVSAVQDGIHANDSVRIRNADIGITAGDDGITVSNDDETAFLYIESGNITIPKCYEGMEAVSITIAGGTINITPTDDGINASGRIGNPVIRMTGGDVTIINPAGRDADGLDSNGSIYIEGGRVFISVSDSGGNYALDCGTENGGECIVSGGTVIACGGSGMAEGFDSGSAQGFLMRGSTGTAGTVIKLEDNAGKIIISEEIPCSFSSVILSAPGLKVGDTCTLTVGDMQEKITIDNAAAAGFGFGRGGMARGGMRAGQDFNSVPEGQENGGNLTDMPNIAPDGNGRPRGMNFPDGTERPDSTESSDGAAPPNGMNRPDGEGWPAGQGMADAGPGRGDGTRFQQQREGEMNPAGNVSSSAVSAENLVLPGISVIVLLIGLFVAIRIRH